MIQKILPLMASAFIFLAACGDGSKNTIHAASPEDPSSSSGNTKWGGYPCSLKNVVSPADSIVFSTSYDSDSKKVFVTTFVRYENGTSKENVVKFCESFMKENAFTDFKCDEGSESMGYYSTGSLEVDNAGSDIYKSYMEKFCSKTSKE